MAIGTFILVDIDGPPPEGGGCRITADYDDTAMVVTAVHYYNTTVRSIDFSIWNAQHTRRVQIAPGTALTTINPPFSPGNWTPTVVRNPDTGMWGLGDSGIRVLQ